VEGACGGAVSFSARRRASVGATDDSGIALDEAVMNIWHDTEDARRTPRRVSPEQQMDVTIGTWPIAPGQSVWVTWEIASLDGRRTTGTASAQWQRNSGVNSYWAARLGPFADGDKVTYTVHGSSADGAVQTGPFTLHVRPALYVAWLWYQHQPLYRDPAVPTSAGSYRYPWVRLHALRDYYSMAALAGAHDVHVTFNLTPCSSIRSMGISRVAPPTRPSTSRDDLPRR
jgi:hypothetical protein